MSSDILLPPPVFFPPEIILPEVTKLPQTVPEISYFVKEVTKVIPKIETGSVPKVNINPKGGLSVGDVAVPTAALASLAIRSLARASEPKMKYATKNHVSEHAAALGMHVGCIVQQRTMLEKQIKECRESRQREKEEEDDPECSCEPQYLTVFYVNVQSLMNADKAEKQVWVRDYILRFRPDIVALVETWHNHDTNFSTISNGWGLTEYELYTYPRRDEGRRGGGIVVGWRRRLIPDAFSFGPHSSLLSRYPTFDSDFLRFFQIRRTFKCRKCRKVGLGLGQDTNRSYGFAVYYRRPARYGSNLTQSEETANAYKIQNEQGISAIQEFFSEGSTGMVRYGHCAGVIVGDFNWKRREWESHFPGVSCPFPFCDVPTLSRSSTSSTTRMGTTPDGVMATPPEFVSGRVLSLPCATTHNALFFRLNFGKDYPLGIQCRKCSRRD